MHTAYWMIRKYSCQRGAKLGQMKRFYFLVDVSALTTFINWKPKHPGWEFQRTRIHWRIFVKDLAKIFVTFNIIRRAADPRVTATTRAAVNDMGISSHLRKSPSQNTGQRSEFNWISRANV